MTLCFWRVEGDLLPRYEPEAAPAEAAASCFFELLFVVFAFSVATPLAGWLWMAEVF